MKLHAHDVKLHCPQCGYNLTGIPEVRCPECGYGFDHAAVRFLAENEGREHFWGARRVLVSSALSAAGAVMAIGPQSAGIAGFACGAAAMVAACVLAVRYAAPRPPGVFDSVIAVLYAAGVAAAMTSFCLAGIGPMLARLWASGFLLQAWLRAARLLPGHPQSTLSLPEPARTSLQRHRRAAQVMLAVASLLTLRSWL